MGKRIIQFRGRESEIHGHKYGPQFGARQKKFKEFRAISQHRRHPVALFDSQSLKPATCTVDFTMEIQIADPIPIKYNGGFMGM